MTRPGLIPPHALDTIGRAIVPTLNLRAGWMLGVFYKASPCPSCRRTDIGFADTLRRAAFVRRGAPLARREAAAKVSFGAERVVCTTPQTKVRHGRRASARVRVRVIQL